MPNLFYPRYKIDSSEHLSQPLRVHTLLPDYELEDVWRVPVTLTSTQSLELFMDQFTKTNKKLANQGLSGLLFKIRLFMGRLFDWDKKQVTDHLIPGTIRHRYAQQENLKFEDLPNPGTGSFIPVYQLENEFLSEIENSTVQAALHLSRVPSGQDYTIHLSVYVKPRGWFGRSYMLLIKPFRLWIVYPAMMRSARTGWEGYLKLITNTESGIK